MIETDKKWRVLVVHGRYREMGGEDTVFDTETTAMEDAGWAVDRLIGHNADLEGLSKSSLVAKTIWNREWGARVRERVQSFRPDIVHFHNTFPSISPAAIWGAKREGAPVVQTLHNYRLACVDGTLFRDGEVCTDCVGRVPIPAVRHGCWGGRGPSALAAGSMQFHRLIGTYRNAVDRFIVLTEASRELFIKIGLPERKLAVKPNALYPEPPVGHGGGGYVMYAGRLSTIKGILVLLDAWRSDPSLPLLKIAGDGPHWSEVQSVANELPNVEALGAIPRVEVLGLLQAADCLIMPSICMETCGMTMVEALASGTPIVASDFPTVRENLGEIGGLYVSPSDPRGLAAAVHRIIAEKTSIRKSARLQFEGRFSNTASLSRLASIYRDAEGERDG